MVGRRLRLGVFSDGGTSAQLSRRVLLGLVALNENKVVLLFALVVLVHIYCTVVVPDSKLTLLAYQLRVDSDSSASSVRTLNILLGSYNFSDAAFELVLLSVSLRILEQNLLKRHLLIIDLCCCSSTLHRVSTATFH